MNIDDYAVDFVRKLISEESRSLEPMVASLRNLDTFINAAGLTTSASGLNGEAGEFSEIVKKLVWHGKEFTPAVMEHLQKELGDIAFYFCMACMALGVWPSEILELNMLKLKDRYPGGSFDAWFSEHRKEE